jgi:hypothetical protein
MAIPLLESVKAIEQQYRTGEEPVLVMCSDMYATCLKRSKGQVKQIIEELPKEWNVSGKVLEEKLQQLFDEQRTAGVWDNFVECINENISNG